VFDDVRLIEPDRYGFGPLGPSRTPRSAAIIVPISCRTVTVL
jgi:hypothetical protein